MKEFHHLIHAPLVWYEFWYIFKSIDFLNLILSMLGHKKHGPCRNFIVDKEAILGKSGSTIQVYWTWKHIKAEVCINTPPVLAYASLIDFTMVKKPRWNCSNWKIQCRITLCEIDRNLLFKGVAAIDASTWMLLLLNDEAHTEIWCNVESRRNPDHRVNRLVL
jgi:hypothetical protein